MFYQFFPHREVTFLPGRLGSSGHCYSVPGLPARMGDPHVSVNPRFTARSRQATSLRAKRFAISHGRHIVGRPFEPGKTEILPVLYILKMRSRGSVPPDQKSPKKRFISGEKNFFFCIPPAHTVDDFRARATLCFLLP